MTPPSDRPTLRVGGPAELLALLPYLLGFHPTSSLVVVALAGSNLLNVARLDLPATEQMRRMTAALHRVAATTKTHGATGTILVGYGTTEQVDPSMRAATVALTAASVPVKEALRVDTGRYWSYLCDNPDCCPPQGVPFDPTTTVAAAAATTAGLVALPDRTAVAARLAPVTGAARDRMAEATAGAAQFLLDLVEAAAPEASNNPHAPLDASLDTPLGRALLAAGRTYLTQAQHRYRAGAAVDDDRVALMTMLLELPQVREFTARRTTAAQWEIDMWADLVRRAEPEFATGPAIMLTLAALQAGDGALAAIAVQRALQADPSDRLANLLAQAVAEGIDPATVTKLLAG
ncbi:DUF4192 domain-containing protein [Micromonospora globbae]|uniref:DUF4192 domain-containing protein n=1 Tax=Micromonospora globbae TaxID=1894969 RepID=UPI0034190DE4